MHHRYHHHHQRLLFLLFISTSIIACGDSSPSEPGSGDPSCNNDLCAALAGQVYYVTQKWDTGNYLDYLRDPGSGAVELRKNAFYFEQTAQGLRFIEVVKLHDLSAGYHALAGQATIEGDPSTPLRLTLSYNHFCSQSEQISEENKGSTIDTILTTYAMCSTTESSNTYANVTVSTTTDGAKVIADHDGELTLVQAFHQSAGSTAAAPLLGAYVALDSTYSPLLNPYYYLYLFQNDAGQLRYALLAEDSFSSSTQTTYAASRGSFTADVDAGTISFSPSAITESCGLNLTLLLGESPFFPPHLRWDTTCTTVSTSTALPYPFANSEAGGAVTFSYQANANPSLMVVDLLVLNDGTYDYAFGRALQGGQYPGTNSAGAHYIWSVVPPAVR